MRYRDIVSESKNVGVLYHFTDLHSAWAILEEKKMKIGDTDGSFSAAGGVFAMTQPRTHISFTRNPRLNRLGQDYPWGAVRIALDGNKLSSRYKITPYIDDVHGITRQRDQAEEAIAKHKIDISGCVIRVDLNYFEFLRGETDYERWCSMPDEKQKETYKKQAMGDVVLFMKTIRSLGYKVNVVKKF